MPSEQFWQEVDGLTIPDLQLFLLEAAKLFPGGNKAARDFALKTYSSVIPEDASPEEDTLRIWQVGEFLTDMGDPPLMFIENLMPDFALVALSAKPKFGKSLAAIDLMDSVCQGKPVWGRFKCNKPGPVFYFAMEDGKYEIANRLLARGIKPGDKRPFFVCYHRFNLSTPEAITVFKQVIAAVCPNPSLVCVDTAREALGIKDWSSSGEVTEKTRPLRNFAREVCPVLLITHNRKAEATEGGDEISGSNSFTGALDGWMSGVKCEKAKGIHRLHLKVDGRGGMKEDFILDMNVNDTTWRALSDEEAQIEERRHREEEKKHRFRIIGAIVKKLGGEATTTQILEELQSSDTSSWKVELRQLQLLVRDMEQAKYLYKTNNYLKTEGAGRSAPYYGIGSKFEELGQSPLPHSEGTSSESEIPEDEEWN